MRAGLATLPKLEGAGFYEALGAKAKRLAHGLHTAIDDSGIPGRINMTGSLLTLFFSPGAPANYATAKTCNTKRFGAFFREMLSRGVLLPPSQFEALFVSSAHTDDDIDRTISAARESLLAISESR
jgi:glutamate-1-semialdehyde 2,1-aminomutase